MGKISRKQLSIAIKADLVAKRFVLTEKLNNCKSIPEYMDLLRRLDLVNNHLECIQVREQGKSDADENVRVRIERASKELSISVTRR